MRAGPPARWAQAVEARRATSPGTRASTARRDTAPPCPSPTRIMTPPRSGAPSWWPPAAYPIPRACPRHGLGYTVPQPSSPGGDTHMKMKRAATTLAVSLVIALIVAACASMSGGGPDLVARGLQAQGGADALTAVKTVSQRATVRYWEPEQSAVAGGDMRFANESTLVMDTDVSGRATRMDWVRRYEYPSPRSYTFSEIVTAEAGYVAGIDSSGRNKQSMDSNPPAHSMSGLRLAAAQRELLRTSPVLLLEMSKNPDRVAATGDVTYDLVLADWQVVEGVRVATSQKYELNGRTVVDARITEVKINAPVAAD